MTTTLEIDEKAYGQLLRETLPHLIRTAADYDRLAAELQRLDELDRPSAAERSLPNFLRC